MRILLLVLALAISAPFAATLKADSHIPRQTNKPDANAQQHESKTVAASMQALSCDKSEDEVKKDKYEANEKPSLDRDVTKYTGWITGLTLGLLAAAVAQAGLFWWQLRMMRDSLAEANRAFILTQRPRLRVRNIAIDDRIVDHQRRQLFVPGEAVSGQFYVSNVGGTAATITASYCMVYWSNEGLPTTLPHEGADANGAVENVTLLPGESVRGSFVSDLVTNESDARTVAATRVIGAAHLYIMGWVDYVDDIRIKRRTAFCREYRLPPNEAFHHGRFYAVDDPDYEHEE